MSHVRQKGDKASYWMLDTDCIGRECFAPGLYQVRGATMSGSRSTGSSRPTCMRNAYHGCPHPKPESTPALKAERKKEGWKNA